MTLEPTLADYSKPTPKNIWSDNFGTAYRRALAIDAYEDGSVRIQIREPDGANSWKTTGGATFTLSDLTHLVLCVPAIRETLRKLRAEEKK